MSAVTSFKDLVWSDLCVSKDPDRSWFKATPDSMRIETFPASTWDELRLFFAALQMRWDELKGKKVSRHGFRMHWPPGPSEGPSMRLRVKRMLLARIEGDEPVYVCRAYRFNPKDLNELGLPAALISQLLNPRLRNGIGLFLGRPGAGKTTLAAAYGRERAEKLGGVTWTVESPVEIDLEGRHGKGVIHQREVETDDELLLAVQDLARATPNVLYVGEVLSDEAAQSVVQASQMGLLVICTYHANDLISGIERFARAAAGRAGEISTQFVEALRFAVHLELRIVDSGRPPAEAGAQGDIIKGMATGNPPRILSTRSLFFLGEKDEHKGPKGQMRVGEFDLLSSEIERQSSLMLNRLEQPVKSTGRR